MEKKKNALTDEIKTKINYTTEFLRQNGLETRSGTESVWFLVGADGEALYYKVGNGELRLCATKWGTVNPSKFYTIRGEKTPNEDPQGVLEVADDLGVFRFYDED